MAIEKSGMYKNVSHSVLLVELNSVLCSDAALNDDGDGGNGI